MRFRNWSCGPETLVQCNVADREYGEWVLGEHVEDMTAAAAEEMIARAIEEGAEPIREDWGVIAGFSHPKLGAFIFGDCDECTYEEFYGESYTERTKR